MRKYFSESGYQIRATACRTTGEGRIQGGAPILIRFGISYLELPGSLLPTVPFDACALLVLPTERNWERIRLTGIYCPPPPPSRPESGQTAADGVSVRFRPSLETMRSVFAQQPNSQGEDGACGHMVAGDLNPKGWAGDYQRWMAEAAAWELSDPDLATHATGGRLDKFIFRAWGDAPGCFLQAGSLGDGNGERAGGIAEDSYPAVTVPVRLFSGRHPAILRVSTGGGVEGGLRGQPALDA